MQNILSQEAGTAGARVTVDQRSNVLIFNGDAKTYAMVRALVVDLDIPGRPVASSVPVTRVYALKFADAVSMAEVLRGLVSGGTLLTNPVAAALQPESVVLDANGQQVASALAPPPVTSFAAEDITIQPVLESNSVVVRARAEVQADLAALIAELDQRRPQVLIEAAIVKVSGDISEQIGVQLGLGAAAPPGGGGDLVLHHRRVVAEHPDAARQPGFRSRRRRIVHRPSAARQVRAFVAGVWAIDQGQPAVHPQHHHVGQPAGRDHRRPERALPHRQL